MWLRRGLRLASAGLAVFAIAWAVSVVRTLPPRDLYGLAVGIQRGDVFRRDDLRTVAAEVDPDDCRTETRRGVLLLRIGVFDADLRARDRQDLDQADRDLREMRIEGERLLACAPSEALGWLALYIAQVRQEGFGPKAMTELSALYRNAPREAWLQMLRLPSVLRVKDALPIALQTTVAADFEDLLSGGLDRAAATVIAGAPAAARSRLLASTCSLRTPQKFAIAHELDLLGADVVHPCLPDLAPPAFRR